MSEADSGDEISLREIYDILKSYKLFLLIFPLVITMCSAIWAFGIAKPRWQSSAVLEIGHMYRSGEPAYQLVEPVVNMVARMQNPSFKMGVPSLIHAADPVEKAMAEADIGSLKVERLKETDLVQIQLRSGSAMLADKLIKGCVENIRRIHEEMMRTTVRRYQLQLDNVNNEIVTTRQDIGLLRKKLLGTHDWNAFDATLSATILKDKSDLLRELMQRKLILDEALSPERTYNTRVLGDVSTSSGPVSPNSRLIVGAGFLLGLVGAVVIALIHNFIRRAS